MQVHVYDVADLSHPVGGNYTLDTSLGIPAVGDEIYLRRRDYDDIKKAYLAATVRTRRWIFTDNESAAARLEIFVQRNNA